MLVVAVGRISATRTSRVVYVGWPREMGLEGFMCVNPSPAGPSKATVVDGAAPGALARYVAHRGDCSMALFVTLCSLHFDV